MRKKTLKTVVTFTTTSDAMAMVSAADVHGISGRIIPVPTEIDAGCGLAWCCDVEERDELVRKLRKYALSFEGLFEVMMY